MEVLSDSAAATGDVKMVIVGIADDADTLVGGSGSVRRRTTEIGVPRMPDDEISNILVIGFRLLGLEADEEALRDLVFYCDGFPYFAHLLTAAARGGDQVSLTVTVSPKARCTIKVEAVHTLR